MCKVYISSCIGPRAKAFSSPEKRLCSKAETVEHGQDYVDVDMEEESIDCDDKKTDVSNMMRLAETQGNMRLTCNKGCLRIHKVLKNTVHTVQMTSSCINPLNFLGFL